MDGLSGSPLGPFASEGESAASIGLQEEDDCWRLGADGLCGRLEDDLALFVSFDEEDGSWRGGTVWR